MGNEAEQGEDAPAGRAPSQPGPDPLVGRTIDGRYEVECVLGEGGMGLVYKARHVVLNKPLALKVLRPDVSKNEEIITRFRQEAQSASAIGNEHIIDISDFGTLPDGSTYFVMEFLDGVDLTHAIENERPFAPARAIHIAKQICHALGAAHDAGIVHRDLKPDNVILIKRGRRADFVKVLDFGIAKVGGGASKLTRAGQVFGTPHYMSPEQCSGTGVDHRTDIYALGVILYEMLTGQVPFDADTLMGVLTKHLYEQPVAPSQLTPPIQVHAPLEQVVMRCLAKAADERFQSMAELLSALEEAEASLGPEALQAYAGAMREPTGRMATPSTVDIAVPSSRRPLLVAAVGLLVLGGIGTFVAVGMGGEQAEVAEAPPAPPPEPAAAEPVTPEPEEPELPEGQVENTEETGGTETARVAVQSEPEGVEVWREGSVVGNTPIELERPPEGEHIDLELRKSGYESQKVRISSFTQESVQVTLEQEKDRARSRRATRRRTARRPAAKASPSEGASQPRTVRTEREAPKVEDTKRKPSASPAGRFQRGSEVLDPWGNRN